MRYDKGHKNETHRRILNVASKQFLKNGIDAVGIAAIMKEAGLTNGAFYAHFKSKDALVTEMLDAALDKREKEFLTSGASLAELIKLYLSPSHRNQLECGCPISALLSELVRHSNATRKILTKRVEKTISGLSSAVTGNQGDRKKIAITIISIMFGALQLSRAVTDKQFADEILAGAYETAMKLIAHPQVTK